MTHRVRLVPLLGLAPLLGLLGPATSAAAPTPLAHIRVDVEEEAQPVRDVLRRLEEKHGLNYVVAEAALRDAGTVTVALRDVPLDAALEAICAASGLSLEIRGPILVILPRREGDAYLPKVDGGLVAPRTASRSERGAPAARRDDEFVGRVAPPADSAAFRARPPRDDARQDPRAETQQAMAVGTVTEVAVLERRLQLHADGVNRDFYLPSDGEGDPRLQAARLAQAIATLVPGNKVALLYRREGGRAVMTDLIGGSRVADQSLAAVQARRATRDRAPPRRAPSTVTPPVGPTDSKPGSQTAPESDAAPAGEDRFVVGLFVARDGEEVRIRRTIDGVVVTAFLPPHEEGNDRRARMLAVLDTLPEGARVALPIQERDGRFVLQDTGVTQIR